MAQTLKSGKSGFQRQWVSHLWALPFGAGRANRVQHSQKVVFSSLIQFRIRLELNPFIPENPESQELNPSNLELAFLNPKDSRIRFDSDFAELNPRDSDNSGVHPCFHSDQHQG